MGVRVGSESELRAMGHGPRAQGSGLRARARFAGRIGVRVGVRSTFGGSEDRLLTEELVRWLAVEDVGGERLGLVLLGQLLRRELRPLEVALLARVRGRG